MRITEINEKIKIEIRWREKKFEKGKKLLLRIKKIGLDKSGS